MEDFVRKTNSIGYERRWNPLDSPIDPARRGLVNEAAFSMIRASRGILTADTFRSDTNLVDRCFAEAWRFVGGSDDVSDLVISPDERHEALEIGGRLSRFFQAEKGSDELIIDPSFPGSGLISTCRGDVVIGKRLICEVKSGDRTFRSSDFRQILVYCALEFAHSQTVFEKVGICNPRTGMVSITKSDEFCQDVAGTSPVALFQSMIEAFSANLVSL